MAINILFISAMSAEAEHVSSSAQQTIVWERLRLRATAVEQSKIIKLRGFVMVGITIKVINLKGFINKRVSQNKGRDTVNK